MSTQNIFVTEFNELTESNKPFAVCCNHSVFCKNCSGLSIILAISDVVLGLFTTWICHISDKTFCFSCNDIQNTKLSSSDTSKIFLSISAYGEKPLPQNSGLYIYFLNSTGFVKTLDFSGLFKTQLCTDK